MIKLVTSDGKDISLSGCDPFIVCPYLMLRSGRPPRCQSVGKLLLEVAALHHLPGRLTSAQSIPPAASEECLVIALDQFY